MQQLGICKSQLSSKANKEEVEHSHIYNTSNMGLDRDAREQEIVLVTIISYAINQPKCHLCHSLDARDDQPYLFKYAIYLSNA